MNDNLKILKKILSRLLKLDDTKIDDQTSMNNVSIWDSLKHMELIVSIEEEFKISRLRMEDIVEMTSLGAMRRILKSKGIDI